MKESKRNSWRLKFWRVPHLYNLELLHASNITHNYPRHVHEEYCFGIMLQGVETHVCRGKSYQAFPGDLLLLNADEAHSSKSAGSEYRVIHIHPTALSRIATQLGGQNLPPAHFSNPVVTDPSLSRLLLLLHLKLEQNLSHLEQESELLSAIGLLLKRHNKVQLTRLPLGKEPHGLKLVLDYLKSHYTENISLSTLAAIADLSPYYLLRVFHQRVGVPPHEYQTQLRISHARRLICKGLPISQAALQAGFFDQSHLSRNFKRITGVPPGRYASYSNIVQDAAE
jgi:AraC-like DNA-binding protein